MVDYFRAETIKQ